MYVCSVTKICVTKNTSVKVKNSPQKILSADCQPSVGRQSRSRCSFLTNERRNCLALAIVIRGKWLGRPVSIRETNKQAEIYVGRPLTLHIFL